MQWGTLGDGQILKSGTTILGQTEMVKDTRFLFVNIAVAGFINQNLKIRSTTVGMKTQPVMMIDILKDCGKKGNTHSKKMNYEMLTFRLPLCNIHVVIGWFLGALAWRTCGRDCAASGMGATTQRKKLAYNVSGVCLVNVRTRI